MSIKSPNKASDSSENFGRDDKFVSNDGSAICDICGNCVNELPVITVKKHAVKAVKKSQFIIFNLYID